MPSKLAFPKPERRPRAPKPLRRWKRMRKQRARRIDRKSDEERVFLAWLVTQTCEADGQWFDYMKHVCYGPLQVAHPRNMTGLGLKESDLKAVRLCESIHTQYDQHRGAFRDWTREERLKWFAEMNRKAHVRFARDRVGGRP